MVEQNSESRFWDSVEDTFNALKERTDSRAEKEALSFQIGCIHRAICEGTFDFTDGIQMLSSHMIAMNEINHTSGE